MGETRAPNIRRPPRARESQENHRRDNRGPHPEKGRGKPGGGSSGSHNADIPGGPRRQAHRLRRQPATPEQTGPWARRSKGPPPPSRGPAKPGGPGPAKRPPRVGQRSPEHPAPERETTNALAAGGILHRQGVVVGWGGRMHANKYSRTRPICRHTKMDTVPTITLPICTLYSWIQAPLPPEGQSELNPLHSGVKTGRPPRSPAPAEKTTSPDPDRMASSSSQPPAPDRGQRTENRAKEATGSTDAPKAPAPGPSPRACTNPRSRRHTNQDPSPPGPARIPAQWRSSPRTPSPPRTYPGAVRPPGRQPTSAGTGFPSSAACSRQKNNTQEPPTPHPGKDRSPSAEPPKKPTPRELPDAPSPYGPPTPTTKTKAGQNRDPHSH
ncbi:hypothetical protein M9458_055683 [Cirrhinus mrigala]|uniref:Uncharacterized protein n=1 Tax=Cirrhinus mrigala TaxID=683832 RepID=A0ABD0MIY5_CIRMR